jgi:TM2 domain-containing membrane protein YozV
MGGGQGSGGNVLAAICSFFIPGLGQLVQGRVLAAFLFFAITSALYGLVILTFGIAFILLIPAWLLHLWAIVNAARWRGPVA